MSRWVRSPASALWSADVHSHVAACALTLHTGYTLTVGTMMSIRGCENNDCSYYFSPGRRRLAVRPSGAPARQSRERHQTKPKPIEANEKSSLCFTQSPHLRDVQIESWPKAELEDACVYASHVCEHLNEAGVMCARCECLVLDIIFESWCVVNGSLARPSRRCVQLRPRIHDAFRTSRT